MNRNELQKTLQMAATCLVGFAAGQYSQWWFHLREWLSLYLFVGGLTLMVGARAITEQGRNRALAIGGALMLAVIGILGFWGSWRF
jgi:hypothetical protein